MPFNNKTFIFSTEKYQALANDVYSKLKLHPDFSPGKIECKLFPDGEVYTNILEDELEHSNCILIAGSTDDNNFLELYDIAYQLTKMGCNSLKIFIPYFAYSTMERGYKGECVKAKTRIDILSSLPKPAHGLEFYFFDLHTEGLPYYFKSDVIVHHIYCRSIIKEMVQNIQNRHTDLEKYVIGSTDAGRAKQVEKLANSLGLESAFVYKNRISGSETKVTGINADVKDKIVIIYDDMIRSGSSIIKAVEAYKGKGAKKVYVTTSHGVFPNGAIEKLIGNKDIEEIYCLNTHSKVNEIVLEENAANKFKIYSINELIIKNILN